MKLLLAILLPVTAYCGEPDVTKIPWPKAIRDFPSGEKATFTSGRYKITRRLPADADVRAAGGSGGRIVEIILRDTESHWSATFVPQSIAERLLEDFAGRPQLEVWGRGGGGYWSRALYRYISGEYRCVRVDEFEESPRHNNQGAPTTKPPFAPHGEGDERGQTLYLVEIRLPST